MCAAKPHTLKMRFFYNFRIDTKVGGGFGAAGCAIVRPDRSARTQQLPSQYIRRLPTRERFDQPDNPQRELLRAEFHLLFIQYNLHHKFRIAD